MGFWDDLGSTLEDIAPYLAGAVVGYFSPGSASQVQQGTEVAIHGRPKKPPTIINQSITQPLYVAGGGPSSERAITIYEPSTGPLSQVGRATGGYSLVNAFKPGRAESFPGKPTPTVNPLWTLALLGAGVLAVLLLMRR